MRSISCGKKMYKTPLKNEKIWVLLHLFANINVVLETWTLKTLGVYVT